MTLITPVILSGGSGTRLWPLSSADKPKQFHALVGATSMFHQTLVRVADRSRFAAPFIVCGAGHVDHVRADLASAAIDDATLIVEPAARNTAPAIALAAHAAEGDETALLVMPSDHVIADLPAFLAAVDRALPAVKNGALATFGIQPSAPETGYGYLACAPETGPGSGVHHVAKFIEKPDRAQAEAMLADGTYLWNAGIFLMRADTYLAALEERAPAIAAACAAAMDSASTTASTIHPNADAFMASPSTSIDYAVMEHATNVVTVPVSAGWSDIGSWSALYDLAGKDTAGNATTGNTLAVDSNNNLLHAAPGVRISTLGIHDLVVIATGTEVLILPRDRTQEIKAIVDRLNS